MERRKDKEKIEKKGWRRKDRGEKMEEKR